MRNTLWLILLGLFGCASVLFLIYGIDSDFNSKAFWLIFKLRLVKWWGLFVVGIAVGIATLLFQTLTQNDILTPSIIGFDALFILLQTVLVFMLGGIGFVALGESTKFALSLVLMSIMALILFAPLVRQLDLTRLILVGVIFSVLFRSLAGFLQRIIAPEDYLILQSALFASFNTINTQLLTLSSGLIILLLIIVWRMRFVLDVMMLGKQQSIGLGINYQRQSYAIIAIIAVLTATATGLVGPMSFLGLLVVALSNQIVSRMHHCIRIPVVMLVSATTLIVGQGVFEHLLTMKSTLSVVVDSVGGIIFLMLIRNNLGKAS